MRPFSNSSTVHTFVNADGRIKDGRGLGNDKLVGLSHTPGRGTIPSLSSNTKCDKLSSTSVSTPFCKYHKGAEFIFEFKLKEQNF